MDVQQSLPALTAAEITSFRRFNSYPWLLDRRFLEGLETTLGPMTDPSQKASSLGVTLQARIWWYKSTQNLDVDRAKYEQYAATGAEDCRVDEALLQRIVEIRQKLREIAARKAATATAEAGGKEGATVPAWQANAPVADLMRKADDNAAPAGGQAGAGMDAPYPVQFQSVIEAVTAGKPVPGIREIPNTVVRVPGLSPVGKMQAPPKPWERNQVAKEQENEPEQLQGKVLDDQFPAEEDGNVVVDGKGGEDEQK